MFGVWCKLIRLTSWYCRYQISFTPDGPLPTSCVSEIKITNLLGVLTLTTEDVLIVDKCGGSLAKTASWSLFHDLCAFLCLRFFYANYLVTRRQLHEEMCLFHRNMYIYIHIHDIHVFSQKKLYKFKLTMATVAHLHTYIHICTFMFYICTCMYLCIYHKLFRRLIKALTNN